MNMKQFINPGLNNGIENFLNLTMGQQINSLHRYEMEVVKILVQIYGEPDIVNPFNTNDEVTFRQNLMIYNLAEDKLTHFLNLLNDYNNWLINRNEVPKTNIPEQINNLLIHMILLKSIKQPVSEAEMLVYNEFFDPGEGYIAKLYPVIMINPNFIPKLWRIKSAKLKEKLIIEEIIEPLASPEECAAHGINNEERNRLSETLDNEAIRKLNAEILKKDDNNNGGQSKVDPMIKRLTSGSGFVDILILLSIIVTQIFIGLLIAFHFLRR